MPTKKKPTPKDVEQLQKEIERLEHEVAELKQEKAELGAALTERDGEIERLRLVVVQARRARDDAEDRAAHVTAPAPREMTLSEQLLVKKYGDRFKR